MKQKIKSGYDNNKTSSNVRSVPDLWNNSTN